MHKIQIPHSRPTIGDEDVLAVLRALRSGWIARGKEVESFEREFARFLGVAGGVAVSSGTAALHIALEAAGLGAGDRVAIPGYCCASVLSALSLAGCSPVLIDVDPARLVMDLDDLFGKLGDGVDGVVFVHLLGHPGPVEELRGTAIPVIEDCAQSLGATIRGRQVGSFGTASVFSFYATKLMTTAEGGMVLSDDEGLLSRVKAASCARENSRGKAYPYAMSDLEAALGRSQLERLPHFLERRKEIERLYRQELSGAPVTFIEETEGREPARFRFIVRLPAGETGTVIGAMAARGIECRKPFEEPISSLLQEQGLAGSREACETLVSIPLYPSLPDEDAMYVAAALRESLAGVRA
jgi:dTDP-4-amino-4,6-dideoxygalactose transaminase